MRAEVTQDITTRIIDLKVSGVPDIDATQSYHRKSRIFRPERLTIRITDGEIREVRASGGLVLKSGAASTDVGEDWKWHPDRSWGLGDPLSKAPEWVTLLIDEAPAGVTIWRDADEVQAL